MLLSFQKFTNDKNERRKNHIVKSSFHFQFLGIFTEVCPGCGFSLEHTFNVYIMAFLRTYLDYYGTWVDFRIIFILPQSTTHHNLLHTVFCILPNSMNFHRNSRYWASSRYHRVRPNTKYIMKSIWCMNLAFIL